MKGHPAAAAKPVMKARRRMSDPRRWSCGFNPIVSRVM
jgi:hypothetical protein